MEWNKWSVRSGDGDGVASNMPHLYSTIYVTHVKLSV